MSESKKNIVTPRVLKGFRDYLPNEEVVRKVLLRTIEDVFENFGFSPISTPALEYTEILLGQGSEETDKQLYRFNDNGDRDVSLRFDLTIPLARFVSQHKNDLSFPFKRYQIAPVWRAEKPQRGRFREFMQCDIDIIGSESELSDAEVIVCISKTLSKLELNHKLKINSREISSAWFKEIGVLDKSAEILRALDKIDKIPEEKVIEELKEKAQLPENQIKEVFKLIKIKGSSNEDTLHELSELSDNSGELKEAIDKLKLTLDSLKELGLESSNFIIDLSIARGLEYYTGIVFETELLENKIGSVASGGRYDNLTGRFQKTAVPGVGASIGIDRILAALLEKKDSSFNKKEISLIALNMGPESLNYASSLVREFRDSDIKAEIYLQKTKLQKQFKYAEEKNILFALIAGEDEKKQNTFSLKNLKTAEQKEFNSVSEALKYFKTCELS